MSEISLLQQPSVKRQQCHVCWLIPFQTRWPLVPAECCHLLPLTCSSLVSYIVLRLLLWEWFFDNGSYLGPGVLLSITGYETSTASVFDELSAEASLSVTINLADALCWMEKVVVCILSHHQKAPRFPESDGGITFESCIGIWYIVRSSP